MKDRFQREIDYLRLSVTDNCNLRCVYCMEENTCNFLENSKKITDDEIIRIVTASAKLGIKKIRVTGGEPLIRPNIVDLIGRINNIDGIEEIYMTTNGILLYDKIEALVKNGLKGVNISLDSLKEERFNKITRRSGFDKVIKAIDKSIDLGISVKVNTVIMNDINKDEIMDFVKLTLTKPIDIRFIELMPIGIGQVDKGVSNDEIIKLIESDFIDIEEIGRSKKGGPANYIKIKGALGKVGFISAISNCFCENCNRVRLTSDGFLKQCLHFDYGVNLRDLIRNEDITEEQLENVIKENIYNKPEKHLFNEENSNAEIRLMNQIGG